MHAQRQPYRGVTCHVASPAVDHHPQFISSGANTSGTRALRALQALRPLRTINRFPALKLITQALFQSLPLLGKSFNKD
jgi:hypothetical protein